MANREDSRPISSTEAINSSTGVTISGVASSPTEGDSSAVANSPTEGDSSAVANSPTEGDSSAVANSPTEGDSSAVANSPTEGDSSPVANSPTEGDYSAVANSPTEGDSSPVANSPTEGDSSAVANSPTEGDSSPVASSPTGDDSSAVASSPTGGDSSLVANSPTGNSTLAEANISSFEDNSSTEVASSASADIQSGPDSVIRANSVTTTHCSDEGPAKVSISVCTSSPESSVQGLLALLRSWQGAKPELIAEVKFHPLPYNDIDEYRFKYDDRVDVMILCHSIFNRRFAITDVMDALYDKYLDYCNTVIGKEKMVVIAHDFKSISDDANSSRQASFKITQPKAFDTTSLAITCGNLAKKEPEIRQEDRHALRRFIESALQYPREMRPYHHSYWLTKFNEFKPWNERKTQHGKSQEGAGTSNECQRQKGYTVGDVKQPEKLKREAESTEVSISVCTSSPESSVQGLLHLLRSWQKAKPELIAKVKFHPLPYHIDEYEFKDSDPVDVMILCHSTSNRGFSITNVLNALYDNYLDYCSKVIGKEKMAVIAHDFKSIDDAANSSRQSSFKIMQPKAFESTSLAITCGNLAQNEPEIRQEDKDLLWSFIQSTVQYSREMRSDSFFRKGFKRFTSGIAAKGQEVMTAFERVVGSKGSAEKQSGGKTTSGSKYPGTPV
ncbi:uncharacterized protein [Diadema antillarum]|uniref:uncharacterized protein isoform X2 n=1 Tax=Diadema antillarum TaxID=105358 RepID=UPI003A85FB13